MSTNAYITPGQGTFTDDAGNTYQIDINGGAMEKLAGQSTFGYMNNGGGTSAMEIFNNVVYGQDKNSGSWYQWNGSDFIGPVTPPPSISPPPPPPPPPPPGPATGAFTLGGGKIVDPNGNPWRAYGINMWRTEQGNSVQDAACTPLTTFFPGINFLRANIDNYQDPSQTATFVSRCTALKIVVLFEDHTAVSAPSLSGAALTTQTNWYAAVATAYKSNPYVWFGSWNEPGNQNGNDSVSQNHLAVYNAIRNTGNTNPIFLDPIGGGNPSTLGALTASVYLNMTNVGWDMHFYNWMTNPTNSTDQTINDNQLASNLTVIQQTKSKDGVMPVIIGEYGDSSNGTSIDAGWQQCVNAVINNTNHSGSAAWEWAHLGSGDNLLNSNNTALTPYGQMVAKYIKQNTIAPTKPRVTAPLTGTVTTGSWTKLDITVNGVTLPSGKQVHFEVLLPAQYNPNVVYPLMLWLHPNNEGNAWYNGDTTSQISNADANGFYNTVNFRTNYPSICIVAYADQTTDTSGGAMENFGGWSNDGSVGTGTHFSGDTGPNVFATIGVVQYVLANYSADPSRVYIAGFSLGGIGSEYLMLKYNQVNGNPALFTSAMSTAGVLEINGYNTGPTNTDITTLTNVPVWWVSGANDGESIPEHWNLQVWRRLAGNSSYPAPGTSATAAKAGTSQYRFWLDPNIGHQQTDQSGNPYPINTTILNFMYSQTGTTIAPPPPPPPPPPPAAGWTAVSGDPRVTPGAMVSALPSLILSNSDLTITTSGRVYQGVKSSTGNVSGKFYFEVTCNNLTPSFAIGISSGDYDLTASTGLGMDFASVGFYPVSPPQGIYSGSPDTGIIGYNEDANGDVLNCAVDFTNSLIWFSSPAMRQAGPLWNNLIGSDPASGIGGIQIPATGTPYFVTFTDKNGGAVATINLGASDFDRPAPFGFASWSSGV